MKTKNKLTVVSMNVGVVHSILHCENCDWKTEKYKTADKDAKKHVKKTGHVVKGEIGLAVTYKV